MIISLSLILISFYSVKNEVENLILKKYNSSLKYDLCFYGDSKNLWNINLDELKYSIPNISYYNFSIPGFSLNDLSTFYNKNLFNCSLSILNLNESSQSQNILKNSSYYWSKPLEKNSLFNFNLLVSHLSKKNFSYLNGFLIQDKTIHNDLLKEELFNDKLVKNNIFNNVESIYPFMRNKQIILIIHPDRKFRTEFINEKFGEKFLLDIQQNYLEEFELIDFRSIIEIQRDSMYYDANHLNMKGSMKLTRLLIDSLRLNKTFNKVLGFSNN